MSSRSSIPACPWVLALYAEAMSSDWVRSGEYMKTQGSMSSCSAWVSGQAWVPSRSMVAVTSLICWEIPSPTHYPKHRLRPSLI